VNYHFKLMSTSADEREFYGKMGKFFASKTVRKETGGYPINNEPDWQRIVAMEKRRFEIVGFINMEPRDDSLFIHDYYVVAEHRGKGIFSELIKKAAYYASAEKKQLVASVNKKLQKAFEGRGFEAEREKGVWLTMRRV
jgi:GNAT superfamily N-acetyltransferase